MKKYSPNSKKELQNLLKDMPIDWRRKAMV